MYKKNQQCGEIFKQGAVSSDMVSFTQMKGVTSTALVDFTSRCTWCVQDFSSQVLNPGMTSLQFENSDNRMYGHYCYNMSRITMLPKTFSPVLVYQRPSDKPNSFQEAPNYYFPENTLGPTNGDYGAFQKVRPKALVDSHFNFHQTPVASRRHSEMANVFHPGTIVSEKTPNSEYIPPQNNDLYGINKNQIISNINASDKILHSNTDSENMRFFLDTKFGCLDNFGGFSGTTEDLVTLSMKQNKYINGDVQGNHEHLCDSYLDLFNEIPMTLPMENHEMEDKKNRKYKCPHCHVCCANNGQLKGHVRVHTGEKPFVCDFKQCKRSFARNEELTRHRRIHLGLRPHQCVVCTKSFGRKDHLNKHEKTHLKTADKKVHLCEITGCRQSYTRSDALARHQWSAHAIKAKSTKWRTNVAVTSHVDIL